MDSKVLTVKLLDLAEGRETPETWWRWWDEHEPELEALLSRGEFLKLKPCRHGGADWESRKRAGLHAPVPGAGVFPADRRHPGIHRRDPFPFRDV